MTLANLSDEELLCGLSAVCSEARRLLGRLLLYLIEVEQRRLDLKSACSSLYDFCQRRLYMSESEAVRRIEAARLLKPFPTILEYLERGDVHLTALLLLRAHLTEANVYELLAAARGKTKRELEEVLAARAPRPDVMTTITELGRPSATGHVLESSILRSSAPSPAQVSAPPHAQACARARLEPLSPARYRLELTISDEVRAKLERAGRLLGHRIPDGRLELVLDRALDALLAKLEKERLGSADRPNRGVRPSQVGRISRRVRREVFARDGERCSFTDEQGNRCPSQTCLELDHIHPRACGGGDDASNLRVVCRSHNRLHAEQSFGQDHVERGIHLRQSRSRCPPPTPPTRPPHAQERARAACSAPTGDNVDVARRALTKMGFRDGEVRRALSLVARS